MNDKQTVLDEGLTDEAQAHAIKSQVFLDWIEAEKERIEAGDGDALLRALLDVCMSDAPMPNWLNEMLALQQEAWQRLETLVDQGVTAPHVLQEREDVSHNLRVLQTALGSFQA